MLLTILAAVFVLGVLVTIHEAGHFLVAKAVGMRVLRFSIGLGPKLFGKRHGETDYILSAVPFGGYVKIAGMEAMEALEGQDDEEEKAPTDRDFDKKPLWARIFVVSAGVLVNFIWGILLFSAIFYFVGIQTLPSTTIASVDESVFEAVPDLRQLAPGSKITSIDNKVVDSWDGVVSNILEGKSNSIIFSTGMNQDVIVNLPVGKSDARMAIARSLEPLIEARVGTVKKDSPAEMAGIKEGDLIIAIDEIEINSWNDVVEKIHSSPGVPLQLKLRRGNSILSLDVTPESSQVPISETELGEVGLIGIWSISRNVPLPFFQAIKEGSLRGVYITGLIFKSLYQLATGQVSPKALGGPVLIGQLAGEQARAGFSSLIGFMALISISLAIFNLLPVPILDGGHVLFLIIEAVRGKPVPVKWRMRASMAGFTILVLMMILVTINDILRLV